PRRAPMQAGQGLQGGGRGGHRVAGGRRVRAGAGGVAPEGVARPGLVRGAGPPGVGGRAGPLGRLVAEEGMGALLRAAGRGRGAPVRGRRIRVTHAATDQTSPGFGVALEPRVVVLAVEGAAAGAGGSAGVSRRGPTPSLSLIFFSISLAMSGWLRR